MIFWANVFKITILWSYPRFWNRLALWSSNRSVLSLCETFHEELEYNQFRFKWKMSNVIVKMPWRKRQTRHELLTCVTLKFQRLYERVLNFFWQSDPTDHTASVGRLWPSTSNMIRKIAVMQWTAYLCTKSSNQTGSKLKLKQKLMQ